MKPKTPKAIRHGHENLCSELQAIINFRGNIGEKAEFLSHIMYAHFQKEEEYALPPLGLLLALSEGNWQVCSEEGIKMADILQSKLSELKKEHENILEALQGLKIAGEKENNADVKDFVNDLTIHVDVEDQVLYPATILIGNYLKHLKLEH